MGLRHLMHCCWRAARLQLTMQQLRGSLARERVTEAPESQYTLQAPVPALVSSYDKCDF